MGSLGERLPPSSREGALPVESSLAATVETECKYRFQTTPSAGRPLSLSLSLSVCVCVCACVRVCVCACVRVRARLACLPVAELSISELHTCGICSLEQVREVH